MKPTKTPLTLGHLLSIYKGQVYDASLAGNHGPFLLGMAIFSPDGGFREHKVRRYSGEVRPEGKVPPGTVVVATTDMGANIKILGRSATVPSWVGNFAIATGDMGIARWHTEDKILRAYAYWVMRTEVFRNYCLRYARGTAVRRIHPSDIENFPISGTKAWHVPHILEALQAIDEKLELNRQMNATLEAMAMALFQSWFVDFHPVRAKLDGRIPFGIDAESAALFPARFDATERGPVPHGWRSRTLLELANITSGGTPHKGTPAYWGGRIPWISPKSMTSIHVHDSEDRVTESAIGNGTRRAPKGATLVMVRGMGLHHGVRISQAQTEVTFNQDVKAIVGRSIDDTYLLYALLNSAPFLFSKVQSSGHGTGVLPTDFLERLAFIVPPPEICDRIIQPLRELNSKIAINEGESRTLAALRDTLLPKLLSGELSIATEAAA